MNIASQPFETGAVIADASSSLVSIPKSVQRIPWIDNAKAIGIILAFHIHGIEWIFLVGNVLTYRLYKFETSFFISFFLLLSGFNWKPPKEPFLQFFRKMIQKRFFPVVFFNLLITGFLIAMDVISGQWDINHYAAGLTRFFLTGNPAFCFPMWFLVLLMVIEIIHYFLRGQLNSFKRIFIYMAFFMGTGWIVTENILWISGKLHVPFDFWYFGEAILGCFFFQAGILTQKLGFLSGPSNLRPNIWWFIILLFITFYTSQLNNGPFKTSLPSVVMSLYSHGAMFWFFFTSLSGAFMIISLSRLIPANRIGFFIGNYSLGFLGLNGFFYHFLNKRWVPEGMAMTTPFLPQDIAALIVGLLYTIFSLLICVPAVLLLKTKIPSAIGK